MSDTTNARTTATTARLAKPEFQVKMRRVDAVDLINKLATDDAFRREVERDPKGTFAKLGVVVPDSTFARGVSLPEKAVFQDMVRDLKLDPRLGIGPFVAFISFVAFLRK